MRLLRRMDIVEKRGNDHVQLSQIPKEANAVAALVLASVLIVSQHGAKSGTRTT